jgi:hypothetical protein
MIQQYSAKVDKFGQAYAVLAAKAENNKVTLEYYLVFDHEGDPFIKGGILEVEEVLDQTLETYVKEHVAESLPFMVLRYLVDNHEPDQLENMEEVIFTEDQGTAAELNAKFPQMASMIAQKCNDADLKALFI